jgi:recombinational DNA repair ATPase RecF
MMTQSKNRSAHHVVLSLDVTGRFLAGAQLEFADGLNCLIGGRGAGKTTALEFLCFGLGLMPDPKVNPQLSLAKIETATAPGQFHPR